MKKHMLITFFALVFISHAFAVDINLDGFKYSLGMSGNYVESDNVKARVLSFDVGVVLQNDLSKELSYQISLIGNFENGSNQATGLTAEFEPNQAINLREGGLIYTPWSFLRLEVGAINQNYYMSPLLVWNNAFAGVSEYLALGNFYLKAQQAIPNNNTLSRRIGGVDEGTPYFLIETLGLDYPTTDFRIKTEISRYAFKDLSSQVALTSQDFGNSVTGINDSARFLYNFKGTNVSGELSWNFNDGWLMVASGQYLFNEGAPNERNTGTLAEVGAGVGSFLIKVGAFRNESDTAPSFYNARVFGHNNMEGTVVSMMSKGKEYFLRASFVNGNLIESNVRQSDMQIFNFAFVRNYEL